MTAMGKLKGKIDDIREAVAELQAMAKGTIAEEDLNEIIGDFYLECNQAEVLLNQRRKQLH